MNPASGGTDALVRTLVRSINKRVDYSLSTAEGNGSKVQVSLSLQKLTGRVTFRLDDLEAAQEDLMRRNQVRAALKRAIDKMMFRSAPIANTAMLRPDKQAEGFFRSPPSGRKRR